MINIINKKSCCGCGACYNSCPKNAIYMKEDEEGFLYPKIKKEECINCSICEKVCPMQKEEDRLNIKKEPIMLSAWNKNEKIRTSSSSGGIFYAIANYIVKNFGVVCAAGYDNNMNVVHKIITTKQEIKDLQGSKYVQSDIGLCYKDIKRILEKGIMVLFVGTPCQVSGLSQMLQRKYENLYLCDFICHGVPSPKVYKKYKKEIEDKFKTTTRNINFRDKKRGWKNYSVKFEFENGKSYIKDAKKVTYIKGFLKNVYLRPSCYECKFANLNRISDITIGDFWGIEEKMKKSIYSKGVSLVLINSDKGNKLIYNCKNDLEIKEQNDLEFIVRNNPSIVSCSQENANRKKFFESIDKWKMKKLYKKYYYENKYIKKLKSILRRKNNG